MHCSKTNMASLETRDGELEEWLEEPTWKQMCRLPMTSNQSSWAFGRLKLAVQNPLATPDTVNITKRQDLVEESRVLGGLKVATEQREKQCVEEIVKASQAVIINHYFCSPPSYCRGSDKQSSTTRKSRRPSSLYESIPSLLMCCMLY